MRSPLIELLAWSGCPNHPDAARAIAAELTYLGHAGYPVEILWIETEALAEDEQFVGSPTIRIDGVDIVTPIAGAQPSLSCRLYRTRAGRYSPVPDPADIREALETAFAKNS